MSSVYSSYIKRMRMCANENCKGCTYQYEGLVNTEECKEDLLYDAAKQLGDADKCNVRLLKKCKEMERRIAELEAKLPKEGEWIDAYIGGNLHKRCPRCGTYIEATFFANDYDVSFCPVCGSRMRKGEQE